MASLYETILREVEALSEAEQLQLVAQVRARLHGHASSELESSTSILELQGLGSEIWRGRDAQDYVNHERSSWNG